MSVSAPGDRPRHFGKMWWAARYLVAAVVLIAALMPMARLIPSIFRHQEADGARDQLQLLDSLLPADAVIYSGGSLAIDLFGPGLGAGGGREILSHYNSEGQGPADQELLNSVGDAALAAGRQFFVMTESDDPPAGHFLWARAWWGEWTLRQMVSKDRPQPLKIEDVSVYFRIYRAMGVAPASGRSLPQVRLYEAEALPSQTGRLVEDAAASNGWARVAEVGRDASGALIFGPYVELLAGHYVARFHLRSSGDSRAAPFTLLVMGEGERKLAEKQLGEPTGSTYDDFDVPFVLMQPEKVEFSLIFNGAGQVWPDWVEVLFDAQAR